jgi:hypothetical protein
MNGSKKARNVSSLVNRNTGGGNKKAGFGPQVGRSAYTSVVMGITTGVINYHCCGLKSLQLTVNPNVKLSRPTGSVGNSGNTYWSIPGVSH